MASVVSMRESFFANIHSNLDNALAVRDFFTEWQGIFVSHFGLDSAYGDIIRGYLCVERGISEVILRKVGVFYLPEGFMGLFGGDEVTISLLGVDEGHTGRVCFPWWGFDGKVCGWSGRCLEGDFGGKYRSFSARYFHPGGVFFGEGKFCSCKGSTLVLLEGVLDVLSYADACLSTGVVCGEPSMSAVSLGTSLVGGVGIQRLKYLVRGFDKVLYCADADAAGLESLKVVSDVLGDSVDLGVLRLPEGCKDFNDFWRSR